MRALAAAALLVVSACGPNVFLPGLAGSIPMCTDVPPITAAPEQYRDSPIYVANEMPVDAVLAWAAGQPGYEQLWFDRDHLGWITVAFSRDAAARQADLEREFPGVGVVAVQVPWTMAELEELQQQLITDGRPDVQGSGIMPNYGVVSAFLGALEPAKVARIESRFAGARLCIEGIDPALLPAEGPQPVSGPGWRLIGDQDETGHPYRTGVAADETAFATLWAEIGLDGEPPSVDFETEIAIWFGAVHGSSCPRLRLDAVVADLERSIVHADITSFEAGLCTADAIGHAYVVAFERARLPMGPFTIQLQAAEPPPGAVEEKTIVDANLSIPGSTLTPDQLHSAPPVPDEARVESGGYIEPDYPWRYRLSVRCGIQWLGELNDVSWRLAPGHGDGGVPARWQPLVDADRTIDLEIIMSVGPEPEIEASAGGFTVTYAPSSGDAPACG